MALLFLDSFDHYASADVFKKWTGVYKNFWGVGPEATIEAGGRFGNRMRLFINGMGQMWLAKTLSPTGNGAVIGAACQPAIAADTCLFILARQGAVQCQLYLNGTGTLSIYGGGGLLGTSTKIVASPTSWNYYEFKVTVETTGAAVSARVNGEVFLNLINRNCAESGANGWDQVWLGSQFYTYSPVYYDDFYVLDHSGAACNDFWGDVRIDPHWPDGSGSAAQWAPSPNANWANVNDAAPDGDSTINSGAAIGDRDSFHHEALKNPGGAIRGLQVLGCFSKERAGPAEVANRLEFGGVEYLGASYFPAHSSYGWAIDVHGLSPDTGVAWDEAEFNAMQLGYKRTA